MEPITKHKEENHLADGTKAMPSVGHGVSRFLPFYKLPKRLPNNFLAERLVRANVSETAIVILCNAFGDTLR